MHSGSSAIPSHTIQKRRPARVNPLFCRGVDLDAGGIPPHEFRLEGCLTHDAALEVTVARKGGWPNEVSLRVALREHDYLVNFPPSESDEQISTVKVPCSMGKQGHGLQRIPRKIWQTFRSATMTEAMCKAVWSWQQLNPEYKYEFMDDVDMRRWIEENMRAEVLQAFDRLIPGAFRADLWRYAVLYKEGGVYADVGMTTMRSLRDVLAADDDFVVARDRPSHNSLLYNAFMAVSPGHPILEEVIGRIVENVQAEWMGDQSLGVTGPIVLGAAANVCLGRKPGTEFPLGRLKGNREKEDTEIRILEHLPGRVLDGVSQMIQTKYTGYGEDRAKLAGPHYGELFRNGCVYTQTIRDREEVTTAKGSAHIPRIIHQTFRCRAVTPAMKAATDTWKQQNPDYVYRFYTDADMRQTLEEGFSGRVVAAFDRLRPGAFRADMWRLGVLYLEGGVYADVDSLCLVGLSSWIHRGLHCVFVRDGDSADLYNAFIATEPKNPVLLRALDEVVKHIEEGYYGVRDTDVTGPGVLGEAYRRTLRETGRPVLGVIRRKGWRHLLLEHHIPSGEVRCGGEAVMTCKYGDYTRERILLGGDDWAEAWQRREVYK